MSTIFNTGEEERGVKVGGGGGKKKKKGQGTRDEIIRSNSTSGAAKKTEATGGEKRLSPKGGEKEKVL